MQLRMPNYAGGANSSSLREYQQTTVLPEYPLSVANVDGTVRCSDWRPLSREDRDEYAQGVYYWRDDAEHS